MWGVVYRRWDIPGWETSVVHFMACCVMVIIYGNGIVRFDDTLKCCVLVSAAVLVVLIDRRGSHQSSFTLKINS